LLTDWLRDSGFHGVIEIFSGEPTQLSFFWEILDYILDNLPNAHVVIPTNMTFLLDEGLTKNMETRLKTKRVHLSASIDGKYLQSLNRPFKFKQRYDDEFFEKAFTFAKKWHIGFHPMIYSNGIELWKKNFLWFMEMYEKYNLPKESLYLLEVRNEEWSVKQIYEFYKFTRFLVGYAFDVIANKDIRAFKDFIFKKRGFNILSSPFTTIGRGIGCSIQSTLTVRLGDLAIVPCHRLAYDSFVAGRFVVRDGKIVGIEAENPETFISILTADIRNSPICETCILKHLCSGGCLGAQFESTGNLFAPIPTVCMAEHWKVLGILLEMKERDILYDVMLDLPPNKQASIRLLLEVYDNERNKTIKRNNK